jgi:hypothetical protein
VSYGDVRFRYKPFETVTRRFDRLDTIVHEEHLTAAIDLAQDCLTYEARVILADVCDDR